MSKEGPTANLPGYQAKINILKQIDDAASQYGGQSQKPRNKLSEFNSMRNQDAKRAGVLVMAGQKGIQGKDLDNMNQKYNHENTYRENVKTDGNEDLRSLRSEYDYGTKKKFVDVLGNIKKNNGDGLKGLENLKNHPGAKNMETTSVKSKYSTATSVRRRMQSVNVN